MFTIKRKISLFAFLALIGVLLFNPNDSIAGDDNRYAIGEEVTFKSEILDEDRSILVNLPATYGFSNRNYPVLYVLDGGTHFFHVSGLTTFLSAQGRMPEMIVVAIRNVDRTRDFSPVHVENRPTSGGAEKFLDFIQKELMPFVDRNYRTLAYDILVGHSFGGTFATYALLKEPDLFNAYISISPFLMYADNIMVTTTQKKLKPKYNQIQYFMTLGNEPAYKETLNEFTNIIESKNPSGFEFSYTSYPNDDHSSVPHISVYDGLRSIFSDWLLPDEKFREGLVAIDEHYAQLSKKYGYQIKTPEFRINQLGYLYLTNEYVDKAIATFKENVERYPTSVNVYDSLGEAYEKNDSMKDAYENYSVAVKKAEKSGDPNLDLYKKNRDRAEKLMANK